MKFEIPPETMDRLIVAGLRELVEDWDDDDQNVEWTHPLDRKRNKELVRAATLIMETLGGYVAPISSPCLDYAEDENEVERLRTENAELREARRNLEVRLNLELRQAGGKLEVIESERQEIVRLRTALREITDGSGNVDAILIARAALEGKS